MCIYHESVASYEYCPQLKMTPGEDNASYRETLDEVHETRCRAMVHNIDRSTTKHTECVFTTNMLLAANCPRPG